MSETHSWPPDKEQVSRVVEILKALGKVYLSKSQFREATEKYEQIIRLGVQDAEVYRYLAVALAGQKLYTPEAQRVYVWALGKFPHDKALCLHIAAAGLHNQAEDEQAQHFYEAALQFHPPFAKDLYLRLHHIFHRDKKFDDSFQALKQALYLERSGDDELVTRLTHLGWHYDRLEELVMTLRFLLGNNEENQTIRRSLAFSLAHAIILHHRQSGNEGNLPHSETDLQLIRAVLPDPSTLDALPKVREYCTLQLALLLAEKSHQDLPPSLASQQNKNRATAALYETPPADLSAKAFDYRTLLNELPLEELLADDTPPSSPPELVATKSTAANFNWRQDFLGRLPTNGLLAWEINELPFTNSAQEIPTSESAAPNSAFTANLNSVLIVAPHLQQQAKSDEETQPLIQKTIEMAAQELNSSEDSRQVYTLQDGAFVFSSEPQKLGVAALELFKKIAQHNTLVPEQQQIVLRAAFQALGPSPISAAPEDASEDNCAGLELLYNALHLLQAEIEEPKTDNKLQVANHKLLPAPYAAPNAALPLANRHLLLMNQRAFEVACGTGRFAAKLWAPAYWGAPGLRETVCEVIWHNPLDYITAPKPFALGRFLVIEKLKSWQTYGTYRGRDRSLERPVVLKAMHPEAYIRRCEDGTRHAETVNHLRRLGRLEHPGMALIYDMGVQDGLFFFVREYLEGESLAQTGVQNKRLAPAAALRLLIELCRILRYAHLNGVYHHNLKPGNIWFLKSATREESQEWPWSDFLLGQASGIKITDFFIPGFEETTASCWPYAAPELLFQNTANQRSTRSTALPATVDIFALGMILYDCLCDRQNPFHQISPPSTLSAWEAVTIIPPSKIDANIILPRSCDEAVLRAINQSPLRRFQTVEELEIALQTALAELKELPTVTAPNLDRMETEVK